MNENEKCPDCGKDMWPNGFAHRNSGECTTNRLRARLAVTERSFGQPVGELAEAKADSEKDATVIANLSALNGALERQIANASAETFEKAAKVCDIEVAESDRLSREIKGKRGRERWEYCRAIAKGLANAIRALSPTADQGCETCGGEGKVHRNRDGEIFRIQLFDAGLREIPCPDCKKEGE